MNSDLKYKQYANLIQDDLFLHPYGDHGVMHSKRVLYLAFQLAKHYNLTQSEWKQLAIACCYHDIGRVNDFPDSQHGYDSVNKMIQLGLNEKADLSKDELEVVQQLMIYHAIDDDCFPNDKGEQVELLWKIIKDADALDRLRFDDLDPKYIRLKASMGLIPLAKQLLQN
jgi:HD superfamily phosphodiesterase